MSMAGLVLLILVVAYLLAWPVPIHPVAWQAPAAPPAAGLDAPNGRLRPVESLGAGIALGPEATAIDAVGRVFTGTSDGRILRFDPAARTVVPIAATGGRPLGMAFEKSGTLLICDAEKGLLALSPSGALRTVVTQYGGVPFRFTNDVSGRHRLLHRRLAAVRHPAGSRPTTATSSSVSPPTPSSISTPPAITSA
jgi:hypothetical protein